MAWARLTEPCDSQATRLIAALGAEGALHAVEEGSQLERRMMPRVESLDVDRDLAQARRIGARVVIPGDRDWPSGLHSLAHPPHCLWVRGPLDLGESCERSASIVGARSATHYGVNQAADLAEGLAQRGFAIISGAAYGIDGAAHRGALADDGETVAVVAGGVERAYPAGHSSLLGEISRRGLVVSEVPPGSAPTKWRFLKRNRLIATLTQGTVVVEAGLRSGSATTAKEARGHLRVVCAVPGPVTSVVSAGCHELIRNHHAILVTDAAEVAEALGSPGRDLAPDKHGPTRPEDDLDEVQGVVFAALPVSRAATAGSLAQRSGRAHREVLAALGTLEALGLARRVGERWRKAPQPAE
jgi:DNA processing protein